MRAQEFIAEAKEVHTGIKPDQSAEYAMPGAHRVAGTADRLYDLLRVMMNVAASDGKNKTPMPQESWAGRNNVSVPYTPEEAAMLKLAYDQAGVFWDDAIAPNKLNRSEERPDTYKTSPVAQPKFKLGR